jgi:hypothetical protein
LGEVFLSNNEGEFEIMFDRSQYSEELLDIVVLVRDTIVYRHTSGFRRFSLRPDWVIVIPIELLEH